MKESLTVHLPYEHAHIPMLLIPRNTHRHSMMELDQEQDDKKLMTGSVEPMKPLSLTAASSLDMDIPVWRPNPLQSVLIFFGVPTLFFFGEWSLFHDLMMMVVVEEEEEEKY